MRSAAKAGVGRLQILSVVALALSGTVFILPAAAQVPATTGPHVIEDITGSGRSTSDGASTDTTSTGGQEDRAVTPDPAASGSGGSTQTRTQEPNGVVQDDEATGRSDPTGEASSYAPDEPQTERATAGEIAPDKPTVVVSSWAGAYGAAQLEAVIAPIEREAGIVVERRTHGRDTIQLDGADAIELGQERLTRACREGQLVKLSDWPREAYGSSSAAGGGSGNDDFLVDVRGGCGLPSFAWSSLLITSAEGMKKIAGARYREPGRIADLVNVKRYPGKRALLKQPRRLLEMMLLADGVGREVVYEVLATRKGEDRAFELLEELKPSIEWVAGSREAFAALDAGRVTMAMTYSGYAFRRLIASELRPIWDGHIISYSAWAVPKSSAQRKAAVRFIRAALRPELMAAQARLWPYGPMRRSAAGLVRRHVLLGTELDVFMPTSRVRFEQGVVFDETFWLEQGSRLTRRFEDWLDGVPLGIRVPSPRKAPPAPLPPPPRFNSAG